MPHPRHGIALAGALFFVLVALGCGGSTPCDPGPCGGGTTGTGGATGTGGGSTGGTFPCKGQMCNRGDDACTVTTHSSAGDEGECTPLPALCQMPGADCSCFGQLMMGCACEQQATGDFALFCDVP